MSKRNSTVGPVATGAEKAATKRFDWLIPGLFALALVASLQASSQYAAYLMGYPSTLGTSHIFRPWSILSWAMAVQNAQSSMTGDQYRGAMGLLIKGGDVGIIVMSLSLFALIFMKIARANRLRGDEFMHGSARWAERKDIEAARLLITTQSWWWHILRWFSLNKGERILAAKNQGVIVGQFEDKNGHLNYLRHAGPEHVLCYAPTRSGKGIGLVIPTLLSWRHSVIVSDLKGELFELTAGWRKNNANNHVIRFEPGGIGGASWNPLDDLRENEKLVGDAQNLATLIVDPDGKGLDTHWQKTSQALLVGMILYVKYLQEIGQNNNASLTIIDALFTKEGGAKSLWADMLKLRSVRRTDCAIIAQSAQDMLDRPDEESGSVLSTAKSYLSLYRDPLVANNTTRSDFSIREIMNSEKPVSVYVMTTPTDKDRLRPIVRVFLNMSVRIQADKMEFENGRTKITYKHRLLYMLDEFPSLGKLDIIQESLAYVAGYGIKYYIICQDLNQLKSREMGYGPDETITSGAQVQIAFPPNRIETADHLSKLTGQTTVVKHQVTASGHAGSIMLNNTSESIQEVQRPLLTPRECMDLPTIKEHEHPNGQITLTAGKMLIFVPGCPAIMGVQPLFFNDPVFDARSKVRINKTSTDISQEIIRDGDTLRQQQAPISTPVRDKEQSEDVEA